MRARGWTLLLLASALRAEPLGLSRAEPRGSARDKPANQISGVVLSVDTEARVLRVTTEDGINVEFAYHSKTAISDHGRALRIDDLEYGDRVVVGYIGRELTAKEIDRLARARRPALYPSSETVAGPDAASNQLSSGPVAPPGHPAN